MWLHQTRCLLRLSLSLSSSHGNIARRQLSSSPVIHRALNRRGGFGRLAKRCSLMTWFMRRKITMPFISSLRWVYSDSNIEEIENIHSSLLSRTRTVTHSSKHEDTIFSLATGQGRAGVAVIRISGTATFKAVEKLCQITSSALNQLHSRTAHLRNFYKPACGTLIDQGLLLLFKGPRSFTGQDMAEFHVHGGPSVIEAMLNALNTIKNCRQSEPGEFTQRAFAAGKMDLTEVEGLADLLSAETEFQRRLALRQLAGDTSRQYQEWTHKLKRCLAHLEALIDFADDEYDVEYNTSYTRTVKMMTVLREDIAGKLDDGHRGEILRSGVKVVLFGAPNAGKSSLLNALARRPAAIVSSAAGTTRDVVEVRLNLGGWPVVVTDTAGLRHTSDQIEKEGISRAVAAASEAQIIVLVVDAEDSAMRAQAQTHSIQKNNNCHQDHVHDNGTTKAFWLDTEAVSYLQHAIKINADVLKEDGPHTNDNVESRNLALVDYLIAQEGGGDGNCYQSGSCIGHQVVVVFNKVDRLSTQYNTFGKVVNNKLSKEDIFGIDMLPNSAWHFTSCVDGTGIDDLVDSLSHRIRSMLSGHNESHNDTIGLQNSAGVTIDALCISRARHRQHLEKCIKFLDKAMQFDDSDVELTAEMVRGAVAAAGRITGVVDVEDVLGVIFEEFCIGK